MSVCFPLGQRLFETLCRVRDKTIRAIKRDNPPHVILDQFESDDELDVEGDFSVVV